jgi:hypothetical protein
MVGGFEIERLIGTGSTGAVYEATQASLGRSVALRLIGADHFRTSGDLERFDDQQRRMAALHHPNLVPCYAAGEWGGGRFVATRLIRGASLKQLLDEGVAPADAAIESIIGALDAAHAAGLVHGGVSARNVLVEANGMPYLTDLGLARPGSAEADRDALAAVIAEVRATVGSGRAHDRRTRYLGLAVGLLLAVVAVLVVVLGGGEESEPAAAVPAPAPNTSALGSSLAGATEPLGCSTQPSANTPACTLAQTERDGDATTVKRAGVIRNWVVRGASGTLELQVIGQRGGKSFVAGFSQPALVSSAEPHAFPAAIAVRPGDVIGVRLDPGATVGALRGAAGSSIAQWDGGLTAEPRRSTGSTNDVELMLRADVEYGARVQGPRQLVGQQAADAPRGRVLSDSPLALTVAGGVRVVVVAVSGGVAIDVFGKGRLARLEVPDADLDGELLETTANCGPAVPGGFCLRWRNPGVSLTLEHQYLVTQDGRIKLIG